MVRIGLLMLLVLFAAAPVRAAEKGVVTDMTWGVTQETQERTAAAAGQAGAQWIRMNVSWRYAEPSEGVYDTAMFAKVDRAIALARAAGARVLLLVDQAPEWASGHSDIRYPPQDPADLSRFYEYVVKRYADQVDAWEVWNEPNHPNYWQPDPGKDPNACLGYAAMLRAVQPVIKANDPGAPVLFGGLAWNDYAYLERCFQLDPQIGDFFDVMNTHPYAMGGAAPETIQDANPADGRLDYQTFLAYREIRRTLVDRGQPKPIWLTEFGWSTTTVPHTLGNVSPQQQADYLTRAFKALEADAYVQVAIWYSLRDHGDADYWTDRLGLMQRDFTPKPAFEAFRAYTPPVQPPVAPGQDPPPAEQPPSGQVPPPGQVVPPRAGQSATATTVRVTRRARRGRTRRVRLSGRVKGASFGSVTIRLQRRVRGRWRDARSVTARVTASGAFRRRLRLRAGRRWRAYAGFAGTPTLAASASRHTKFRT